MARLTDMAKNSVAPAQAGAQSNAPPAYAGETISAGEAMSAGETISVDVAVIGAGTAGLAAYRAAKAAGKRVVVIEGGPYGTTCARVGCMPSKLLIAAAEAAHAIERAPGFGVHVEGPLRVDGREVMARVKRERDRFVG